MILILTKIKHDNAVDCEVTVADSGVHRIGILKFPNQITWTRFLGALQRGSVGMRELEVRLDVAEPTAGKEEVDEIGQVNK